MVPISTSFVVAMGQEIRRVGDVQMWIERDGGGRTCHNPSTRHICGHVVQYTTFGSIMVNCYPLVTALRCYFVVVPPWCKSVTVMNEVQESLFRLNRHRAVQPTHAFRNTCIN